MDYDYIDVQCMSQGITLRMSLWDVFRTFLGRFTKTERTAINNFLI